MPFVYYFTIYSLEFEGVKSRGVKNRSYISKSEFLPPLFEPHSEYPLGESNSANGALITLW